MALQRGPQGRGPAASPVRLGAITRIKTYRFAFFVNMLLMALGKMHSSA